MCQNQLIDSLIVFQVDFLNMKELLGLLHLLPEVLGRVHYIHIGLPFSLDCLYQLLRSDLLSAIVDLELIRELIETIGHHQR